MEGDGPLFGDPVPSGVLVGGRDGVAVDATCARLMDFDPREVEYLSFMHWAGLGVADSRRIELRGDRLNGLTRRYERPPTA